MLNTHQLFQNVCVLLKPILGINICRAARLVTLEALYVTVTVRTLFRETGLKCSQFLSNSTCAVPIKI